MLPALAPGDRIVCEYHRTPRRQGQIVVMAKFTGDSPRGECAIKRFQAETPTAWTFSSDNLDPVFRPDPILKSNQPRYPILGIAVFNVTQRAKLG